LGFSFFHRDNDHRESYENGDCSDPVPAQKDVGPGTKQSEPDPRHQISSLAIRKQSDSKIAPVRESSGCPDHSIPAPEYRERENGDCRHDPKKDSREQVFDIHFVSP
jgi:hypothetical protein